jgi:Acetyltransferase (GNAT) domain/Acetyltransferase (GNAT) family
MSDNEFAIRQMTRGELDIAIDWAAAEGWNPGLHDADAYYASDPEGFFIGLLDGEPVGSVSAVKYGPEYAFMGFLIVKPGLRGGLLGPRLAEAGFRHVGSAIAGLDGVLQQAGHYAGIWGFEPAYHNMRYEGVAASGGAIDPGIRQFEPGDLEAVELYDRACFPAPRPAFLERWLRQPEAHALIHRSGDALGGYGMIRRARQGWRIGPLFADDAPGADALFDALVSQVPAGDAVYIDIPQPNAAALELVTRRGMTPMFETARMYRGGIPEIAIEKVFGVTTLELG